MFSSNIIERKQALAELVTMDTGNLFVLATVALAVICYLIRDWI